MKDVGIFEAKTMFPGLCAQVASSGLPVLVPRRGRPLVVISPASADVSSKRVGILDEVRAWEQHHPEADGGEFPQVWKMRCDRAEHPLAE